MPDPRRALRSTSILCLLASGCSGLVVSDPGEETSVAVEPCEPSTIGEDDGEIQSVYRVFNGQLDDVCFGEPDPVLSESWDALAEIAPPEQLDPVTLFAGFTGSGDTLAFATPVDDDHEEFAIAVDLVEAEADVDELRLTMAHEFAHVFTQTPDQLDVDARIAECEIYYNGNGCFLPGSYLDDWIEMFWSADQLATLPRKGSIDEEGGEARCSLDPAFLGSYAASHPEEDFAESFSAFVFAVDVEPGIDPKIDFFEKRPELVAFRDRAAAADREGLPSNFERCG